MKRIVFIALISFVGAAHSASCDLNRELSWCNGDNGFNEGGQCGAQALGGVNGVQLPGSLDYYVLGNTWKRTSMMGAAIIAAKGGANSQAVAAAACCQIHNPPLKSCIESAPDETIVWLRSH